jgi:[ribosomal protein S18]-alanine N-acetyltransferase
MVLPPHAPAEARLSARTAVSSDRGSISDLMFIESHVHRHLDWRAPLDWLGQHPYWLLEDRDRLYAALACPVDPVPIAWIRLFAFSSSISGRAAWRRLWEPARRQLVDHGGATAAAIAAEPWFEAILLDAGFQQVDNIAVLAREGGPSVSTAVPDGIVIRTMEVSDLPEVVDTDSDAFDPLWRNSLEAMTLAHAQASYATVAEGGPKMVGYQLSTGSPLGMHLARLAVRRSLHRRGIGAALVRDLVSHMSAHGDQRLTVNTQATNAASLALYHQLGFRLTGERYPVYTAIIPGQDSSS